MTKKSVVLARPGDPYLTPNGQMYEDSRSTMSTNGDKVKTTPELYKPSKRRTVKEMPAPFNVLKGVACVFVLTLMGLGDREIAEGLGITVSDVKTLRRHQSYGEVFDIICSEFISANSDLISARLAAYSHDAVSSVASIAKTGKEGNRLKASQDILNRAGHTSKVGAVAIAGRNDLRIVITDEQDGAKSVDVHINGGING